jgi:anti-sigma factor RsiW
LTSDSHDRVPDCREVITFLWAYLSGELEPERAAAFERHLEGCPACVSYIETYQGAIALTQGAFDEVSEEDLPEDLVRAVLAARRDGEPV